MNFIPPSLLTILIIVLRCDYNPSRGSPFHSPVERFEITSKPAKWFNNHAAAVSITFDIAVPSCNEAAYEALRRSIPIDIEMITSIEWYTLKDKAVFRDLEAFCAQGVHFFGHGHLHDINYDSLTYDSALVQFNTCFRLMEEWNLSPLAYAYPGGNGLRESIQRAVAKAGFICARGIEPDTDSVFICADEPEPENWFYLPAVCIGNVKGYVHYHAGMVSLFDRNLRNKSWLILMYHSLGDINGWAYYPLEYYLEDLDYIKCTDSWIANMDVVARYIMERNSYAMSWKIIDEASDKITIEAFFSDTLDPNLERVPLTIEMEVSSDKRFYRCDVMENTGASISYPISENRFTFNIIPGRQPAILVFYLY